MESPEEPIAKFVEGFKDQWREDADSTTVLRPWAKVLLWAMLAFVLVVGALEVLVSFGFVR